MAYELVEETSLMKIMALVPLFREPQEWIHEAINNASIYADDVVICINDVYDEKLKQFLYSYEIVRKVAFINKHIFEDSIIDTSLLTLAQIVGFYPDWIVKQDIDEEFEPRIIHLRKFLENTEFDTFRFLWPSYVKNKDNICHYTHTKGAVKRAVFRFDLNKLYIPGRLHTSISMYNPREAVITLNLYHKNLIKSDQENYIKFVVSGREMAKDGCVAELRNQIPQVLEQGKCPDKITYTKMEKDAERLMPHSVPKKIIDTNTMPEIIPLHQFNINRYKEIVKEMYK